MTYQVWFILQRQKRWAKVLKIRCCIWKQHQCFDLFVAGITTKQEANLFFSSLHGLWSSRNDADYWERIHSNSHVSLWEYQTNREEVLLRHGQSHHINAAILRYFNQLVTSISWNWELPLGVPQNLVPFITNRFYFIKLAVYGDITQLLMEPHSWLYSR
jgi:UDP-glucose 4-epimerase